MSEKRLDGSHIRAGKGPLSKGAVRAARNDKGTVLGPQGAVHHIGGIIERFLQFALIQIPNLHRTIATTGGKDLVVWGKGESPHPIAVVFQGSPCGRLLAFLKVP